MGEGGDVTNGDNTMPDGQTPTDDRRPDEDRQPVCVQARVTSALTLLVALVAVVIAIHGADEITGGVWMLAAWAAAPYVVLAMLAQGFRRGHRSSIAILVAALPVCGFGLLALCNTFVHPGAQDALLFVFLPVWQFGGIAVALVVALLMDRPTRSC